MSYDSYVLILSQLATKKKAQVMIDDKWITVEDLYDQGCWQISTKVYDAEWGSISWPARHCINSQGVLKWQDRGAYLKLDKESNAILLIQEIESSKKYIPFKHRMKEFLRVADEWKEILQDFSEKAPQSLCMARG